MKKIILALLLCSCAHGIDDGSSPEPEPEPYYLSPKKPIDVPVPEAPKNNSDNRCVVKSNWFDNCILTQVWCMDTEGSYQLVDVDSRCFPPRPLFPWEYIPDPPPDYKINLGSK